MICINLKKNFEKEKNSSMALIYFILNMTKKNYPKKKGVKLGKRR